MKKKLLLLLLLSPFAIANAQHSEIYNEKADASADFKKAVVKASAENKHVLIQVGGNWCHWCKRFDGFSKDNAEIDSITNASYVVLHVNYSKANRNKELLTQLEYPQRFGFPVFVITDATGKRIHTQNSGFLEKGKSYDPNKVKQFLLQWTTIAVSKAHNDK